jgi:hypothetical protein
LAAPPEKYRRAPDLNIGQNTVALTPEQTAEGLRLIGLSPPLLEMDTGDVDEGRSQD